MSVSNEHLNTTCQVWDGLTYEMLSVKEARKREREGIAQITTNLQAKDLKSAAEFNTVREAREAKLKIETKVQLPPGVVAEPAKKTKRAYKTREMKAG